MPIQAETMRRWVDTEAGLVLAHIDIEEKSNEIPAAQKLLGELDMGVSEFLCARLGQSHPPLGERL